MNLKNESIQNLVEEKEALPKIEKPIENKAPEKKQKVKTTCNKKFGGNAPSCSKEVRSKMETTMLERFGVKNCQQNKDVSTRTKNTIIDRYGGQGNGSKLLKDKYIKTCLNKYGVDNGSKSTEVREKLSIAKRKYTIENNLINVLKGNL